ncbi:MAG TPA: MFS transporter [Verrucomicrobiae bacterium]|nr:MFS transporter [Verrucomicrobiae bacterium]
MTPTPPALSTSPTGPWWRELNRYHWFVLMVCALGWLFDCLDQQLFNLARVPAMRALIDNPTPERVAQFGGYATSIFLIGWATGGLTFGVLGDRIGRARTMMWTILIYSLCTGLSALATGFWDFAFYRFITGLGVGGEFAVGVSLLAEVMPPRARPYALGLLQALSAVGNITAAAISMGFGHLEQTGAIGAAWRWMFVVGAVPALLALVVRARLKEPEKWVAAKAAGTQRLGSYGELFGNPRWRRNAIVGVLLAFAGVVGLWGIGFFSIDLIRSVLRKTFEAQGMTPAEISGKTTFWAGVTSMMLNVGAFIGMNLFASITQKIGRRPTFAIFFVAAMLSTAAVFWYFKDFSQIFWMLPIMGVCQLGLFAGYAIYFPELFPTHLRSTGTSFCYNVGRFVAAIGPTALGLLTGVVYKDYPEPMRYAGVTMCAIFLLGLLVLPFAPETKDQPLPESEKGFSH